MAQSIPFDIRKQIVHLHKSGRSLKSITSELPYSYSGVCKIWRRYKQHGWEGIGSSYSNCGRKPVYTDSVKKLIKEHKNGDQGAPYLRSLLLEKYPDISVPHERTIQRWWQKTGVNLPRGRRPQRDSSWTKLTHHTWQIDGKEQVNLAGGAKVCWINIADEATGSLLLSRVFPL